MDNFTEVVETVEEVVETTNVPEVVENAWTKSQKLGVGVFGSACAAGGALLTIAGIKVYKWWTKKQAAKKETVEAEFTETADETIKEVTEETTK